MLGVEAEAEFEIVGGVPEEVEEAACGLAVVGVLVEEGVLDVAVAFFVEELEAVGEIAGEGAEGAEGEAHVVVGAVFGGEFGGAFGGWSRGEHFDHAGRAISAEVGALWTAIDADFGEVEHLGRVAVGIAERDVVDGQAEGWRAEEEGVGGAAHDDDLTVAAGVGGDDVEAGDNAGEI